MKSDIHTRSIIQFSFESSPLRRSKVVQPGIGHIVSTLTLDPGQTKISPGCPEISIFPIEYSHRAPSGSYATGYRGTHQSATHNNCVETCFQFLMFSAKISMQYIHNQTQKPKLEWNTTLFVVTREALNKS
jgi:hypothetical protein